MFIHHHQVHLNLHILITFELASIYVYVPINKSIVKRIVIHTYITTNSYEIKMLPLHPLISIILIYSIYSLLIILFYYCVLLEI